MEKPEWFSHHEEDDKEEFKKINEKMPSKELIIEQFSQVHQTLHNQNEVAKDTNEGVRKTNGRVTRLERYQTGIMMCLGLIITVIIPLAVYAYNLGQENLKNQIINELKK